jgi:hypothetical protein
MKVSLMRPALVLALALGLASCGGKATFTIAGSITGLQYDGLVLSTNGMTVNVKAPPAGTTAPVTFEFPNQIDYGVAYEVTFDHQPDHQTCTIEPPSGTNTAGRVSTINVIITCTLNRNTVGGKVQGLTSKGLVLANGSTGGTVTPTPGVASPGVAPPDVPFTFPAIPYNQTYGITVQAQPTDPTPQTCTVISNGVGNMGDKPIDDVVVVCKP